MNKYLVYKKLGEWGRCGNQVFEAASTIGIAKTLNRKPLLNPNWAYRENFNIPNEYYGDVKVDYIVNEKVFHYDMSVFNGTDKYQNIEYIATAQSEKYFIGIKDQIKQWLRPKGVKFLGEDSVCIHIRRGDYTNNPNYVHYKPEYYLSAIEKYFSDKKYKFYIVTDDVDYCKMHFPEGEFIYNNGSVIEDFKVLCGCNHKIICNSTFSWWGAYLTEGIGKIIRPPKIFDGRLAQTHSEKDFWPDEDWICHDENLDLSDVTFIIPVKYDHKDRLENLNIILQFLNSFDTNIIVGEQGGRKFENVNARYLNFKFLKEFHRTYMLNRMTALATTPIVINYDTDVLFSPVQILKMVKMLRWGYDFVYPYSGAFLRVGSGTLERSQEYIDLLRESDIGHLAGIDFMGKDDMSVGGAVGYKKTSFLSAGGENENFIAYSPEDVERYERFKKLGFTVGRVEGSLYHLNHYCGKDSLPSNPYHQAGLDELMKVRYMKKKELQEYVLSWKWNNSHYVHFACYADDNFRNKQEALVQLARESGQFDEVWQITDGFVKTGEFYEQNRHILDQERGGGYWLWKPYIISKILEFMQDGDTLLYMDCGDTIIGDIRSYLLSKDQDIFLLDGSYTNSQWTKRDCFKLMGCDTFEYWTTTQLEAGVIAIAKTKENIKLVEEWLEYCKDENILTDKESKAPNFSDFIEHRHDQSILTNLKVKYDLPSSSELREYVICNAEEEMENGKKDLKDVTFVIPCTYDSKDRIRNIEYTTAFLNEHFETNILIGELKGEYFKSFGTHINIKQGGWHRTKLVNDLVKLAQTPIIFNWDADVFCHPEQIIEAVKLLRKDRDLVYPYDGRFVHISKSILSDVDARSFKSDINGSLHNKISYGGAYGFKKESFIKVKGLCELLIGSAPEDIEFHHRCVKLKLSVERIYGELYHIDHDLGINALKYNRHRKQNEIEYAKIKGMDKTELEAYMESWKWF